MKSERLTKSLESLKAEFYEAGEEWKKTRDSKLLDELNALVGAINAIEVFLFNESITTLIDIA